MALSLIRGRPGLLPAPVDNMENRWNRAEEAAIAKRTRYCAVGSPEMVRARLAEMLEETQADEIIGVAQIFDHFARLRSFEIAAQVFADLQAPQLSGYVRFETRRTSQMTAATIATTQSRCSATEVTASASRAKTQMTMTRIAIPRRECFTFSDRRTGRDYVYGTAERID